MPAAPGIDLHGLAVVSTIEQQLTRYFAAMSARADAAQRAAEVGQDELARHFQRQIDALREELDNQPELPTQLEIGPELRAEMHAAIRSDLQIEMHTAMRDAMQNSLREELRTQLREELRTELMSELRAELQNDLQLELRSEQLAEREKVGQRLNQFAAQASALAQQLVDSATALHQRINDTGRALEGQMDEHTIALTKALNEAVDASRATAADQLSIVARKVDENDQRTIDRMLSMEERINDHTGTRFADIDANIGRMTRGVDEAIAAMSHRLAELDAANIGIIERIEKLAVDVSKVDEEALARLSEQMSSAVGESMLVRIEMERLGVSTSEQIDRVNVRIGELATVVADATMDVSTAVQLERLEEIERALAELDPDQFVRKTEADLPPAPVAEVDAVADFLQARDRATELVAPVDEAAEPNLDALAAAIRWDAPPGNTDFDDADEEDDETQPAAATGSPAGDTSWPPLEQPAHAPSPPPDLVGHPRRRASDFGPVAARPAPHLLRRSTDVKPPSGDAPPSPSPALAENPSASPEIPGQLKPSLPSSPNYSDEAHSSDSTLSSW